MILQKSNMLICCSANFITQNQMVTPDTNTYWIPWLWSNYWNFLFQLGILMIDLWCSSVL